MKGKPIEIINWLYQQEKDKLFDIKEHKQKRSLEANAYLWTLLGKIADKLGNQTKEEVYREVIRDKGQYEILPIKNEALEVFKEAWQHNGVGWLCEPLGESKLEGYTNVIAYYGTSVYTTDKMSKIIDYVVQEANKMGISTITKEEQEKMMSYWK